MLEDRISSLRKVNIYERQRYRHIVGLPVVLGEADGAAEVETPFLIVRIMREGDMDVFATGCYRDRVKPDAERRAALRRAHRGVRQPPLRHAGGDSVLGRTMSLRQCCHPERSEGSLLWPQRPLASLG